MVAWTDSRYVIKHVEQMLMVGSKQWVMGVQCTFEIFQYKLVVRKILRFPFVSVLPAYKLLDKIWCFFFLTGNPVLISLEH